MADVTLKALLLRPDRILAPEYRSLESLVVYPLEHRDPHEGVKLEEFIIDGDRTSSSADLPKTSKEVETSDITVSYTDGVHESSLAGSTDCGLFRVLRLGVDSPQDCLVVWTGDTPAGPEEEDHVWREHLHTCKRHQNPELPEEAVDPVQGCPFQRKGPTSVNVTTGSGLPPPELNEARYVFEHGGSWSRIRFVQHYKMSGDRYTMLTTLLLYPEAYVEMLYCDEAKIAGHIDFFHQLLPEPRSTFQILTTRVPELDVADAGGRDDALGFYTRVKPDDRSILVDTYWENPTAMGVSTYMVGQAFHQDPDGSRAALVGALRAALGPSTIATIETYADSKLKRDGLYVMLWIRNESNGKEWNHSVAAYEQLIDTASHLAGLLHKQVRLVFVGSELGGKYSHGASTGRRDRINMIKFWEDGGFPDSGRAGQMYLWHYLASHPNKHFVCIGMRSGALEQLALVGLPTIFLEPKSQAKTERADRMRQWIGRLPYSRCIIEDYVNNDKGEPITRSAALGEELNSADLRGTLPPSDIYRIRVMLYSILRGYARTVIPEGEDAMARWRSTPYLFNVTRPCSLYAAFGLAAGKLLVPEIVRDALAEARASQGEAAAEMLLRYTTQEVHPLLDTPEVHGSLDVAIVTAVTEKLQALGAEELEYGPSDTDIPRLEALRDGGFAVTLNAHNVAEIVAAFYDDLLRHFASLAAGRLAADDLFLTDVEEECGIRPDVDIALSPAPDDNWRGNVAHRVLQTLSSTNDAAPYDGWQALLSNEKRLELSIAPLKAAVRNLVFDGERVREAIRTAVGEKLSTGLSSKGEATRKEVLREVQYKEIEGESEIRDTLSAYVEQNSGEEHRHADREYIGSDADAYWLACCFDQPIVLHRTNRDGRARLIGRRDERARAVHILDASQGPDLLEIVKREAPRECEATGYYYPLFYAPQQAKRHERRCIPKPAD